MKCAKKTTFNTVDKYESVSLKKHDDYVYIRICSLVTSERSKEMYGFNVGVLSHMP
jgi:hypothetical protein